MPVLTNPKHERFAQAVATGKSADAAYILAGYREHRSNAARLSANEHVRSRIEEILSEAAQKAGVTIDRIVQELERIAFADIRKAVEWQGAATEEREEPVEGGKLVIKETFSNHVRLIDSDKIDPDTAAAISEVRQTATGGVSIKFHDKLSALEKLGKHLGMFKERMELTGKNGTPLMPRIEVCFVPSPHTREP